MKKILTSLLVVGVVGSVAAVGASRAFFSDTETSEDNIIAAGKLDLKIDSQAHYAGMRCELVDEDFVWVDEDTGSTDPEVATSSTRPELLGDLCVGTWKLKDLEDGDRFFELTDVKPGDEGENTISIHVFDNDAWGRMRVFNLFDQDNDCTEPEIESGVDSECEGLEPGQAPADDINGELSENLSFHLWLDEGSIPGFQCFDENGEPFPVKPETGLCEEDPEEGDNIFQAGVEEESNQGNVVQEDGMFLLDLTPALVEAYEDECVNNIPGENQDEVQTDGHNNYGYCNGLAADGRLVGSTTYFIGVEWDLDPETGNEAQSDSVGADIAFDVVQWRNNEGEAFPSIVPPAP